MLYFLSPAKTLDLKTPSPFSKKTRPLFLSETEKLVNLLADFSKDDLKKLMGISDKLALLNQERFLNWTSTPKEKEGKQALFLFQGAVYQGLQAYSFTEEDCLFAADHLIILSGLYGYLRPLDHICPYRLEMGTRLKTEKGKDLYAFWTEILTKRLKKELQKQKHPFLVNLASEEYSKALGSELPKIKITFKEKKGSSYRVVAIHAKKARGCFAQWAIKNQIEDPENLQLFKEEGYRFIAHLSNEHELIFHR